MYKNAIRICHSNLADIQQQTALPNLNQKLSGKRKTYCRISELADLKSFYIHHKSFAKCLHIKWLLFSELHRVADKPYISSI